MVCDHGVAPSFVKDHAFADEADQLIGFIRWTSRNGGQQRPGISVKCTNPRKKGNMSVVIKLSKQEKHLNLTGNSIVSPAAATNQAEDPARDLLRVLEQKSARDVNTDEEH